jgi:hypothetical protein
MSRLPNSRGDAISISGNLVPKAGDAAASNDCVKPPVTVEKDLVRVLAVTDGDVENVSDASHDSEIEKEPELVVDHVADSSGVFTERVADHVTDNVRWSAEMDSDSSSVLDVVPVSVSDRTSVTAESDRLAVDVFDVDGVGDSERESEGDKDAMDSVGVSVGDSLPVQ